MRVATLAKVSIILVTRNGMNYLPRCLESLQAQTFADSELTIVDNGSSDGTAQYLQELGKGQVLLLQDNTGFARANNVAIARASGEYLFVVNQDVWLEPQFVRELVRALELDEHAGSACGKLLRMRPDGTKTDVIDSTALLLTRSRNAIKRGAGEKDTGQYDRRQYVFGACGSAVLYRRRMLEEVRFGDEYFDDHFFAYFEDADLSWAAQLRGWRCIYEPRARGYHAGGSPAAAEGPPLAAELQQRKRMHYFLWRNRYLVMMKNDTLPDLLGNLPGLLLFEGRQLPFLSKSWRSRLASTRDAIRMLPKMLAKRRMRRPKGSPGLREIWARLAREERLLIE